VNCNKALKIYLFSAYLKFKTEDFITFTSNC